MNWGYKSGMYKITVLSGKMTVLSSSSVSSTGWFGDGDFETPNSSLGKKEIRVKDTIQVKKTLIKTVLMKSGMNISCKAILSILYQFNIEIYCKKFFNHLYFREVIIETSKFCGRWFGDGGCLILFFALITKNLYLCRIQLLCRRLLF